MLGTTIGHYRIVEQIGAGGMGVVYRAHDERLDRDVALKVLSSGALANSPDRKRFRHEALALSKLNHPNIAVVHDFDSHGDLDVLVMEYVPGSTLSHQPAPLPEREVLRIGVQLAQGLAAAHAQGVLHRDLKPGNLRLTPDGRLKILDFGLARLAQVAAETRETRSATEPVGRIAGTPPYMAPEQLRGEPPDPRSDIYSAGVVLYELATGRLPFESGQFVRLADEILHSPPSPPRAHNPHVSAGLENIILKALDKDPERRYQSAKEMAVDLERLSHPSVPVSPVAAATLGRGRAALLIAGALALAAVSVWLWSASRPPPPPAQPDPIVVGAIENRTGDESLERDVHRELTSALNRSEYVGVVSPDRIADVLVRMRRPGVRVDEAVAREICQRDGYKAYLIVTLESSSNTVSIAVASSRPEKGVMLSPPTRATISEHDDRSDRLRDLAARTRRTLEESVPTLPSIRALPQVTTASLDALRLYAQAVSTPSDPETARGQLSAALKLDPAFAMASRELSLIHERDAKGDLQLDEISRAYGARERVTERERYLIEASYYSTLERYDEVVRTLEALVGLDPNDPEARYSLATAYTSKGEPDKAVDQLKKGLVLAPRSARFYGGLIPLLVKMDRLDEASTYADQASALGLTNPRITWGDGLLAFGRGDTARARSVFSQLAGAPDGIYANIARLSLTRLDIHDGKFAAARARLEADMALDTSEARLEAAPIRGYLLGRIHLLTGHREAAIAAADDILRFDASRLTFSHFHYAGALYALADQRDKTRSVLAALERRGDERQWPRYAQSCQAFLQGELARLGGRYDEAAGNFSRARALYPHYLALQARARVQQRQRRWKEAAADWEAVASLRGEVMRDGFPADLVLAHLELGRIYARLGDTTRASQDYRRFLEAWQDADDAVAALGEGRTEWQQLTGKAWAAARESDLPSKTGQPGR